MSISICLLLLTSFGVSEPADPLVSQVAWLIPGDDTDAALRRRLGDGSLPATPKMVGKLNYSDKEKKAAVDSLKKPNKDGQTEMGQAKAVVDLMGNTAWAITEMKDVLPILEQVAKVARFFGVVGAAISVLASFLPKAESEELTLLKSIANQIENLSEFTKFMKQDLLGSGKWNDCAGDYRKFYGTITDAANLLDSYRENPESVIALEEFQKHCTSSLHTAVFGLLRPLNGAWENDSSGCDLPSMVANGFKENSYLKNSYAQLWRLASGSLQTALLGIQVSTSCTVLCSTCDRSWVNGPWNVQPGHVVSNIFADELLAASENLQNYLEQWKNSAQVARSYKASMQGYATRTVDVSNHQQWATDLRAALSASYPDQVWFAASWEHFDSNKNMGERVAFGGGDWRAYQRYIKVGGKSHRSYAVWFDEQDQTSSWTCSGGSVHPKTIWQKLNQQHVLDTDKETSVTAKKRYDIVMKRMNYIDCGVTHWLHVWGGPENDKTKFGSSQDFGSNYGEQNGGYWTKKKDVGYGVSIELTGAKYGFNSASFLHGECCYPGMMLKVHGNKCVTVPGGKIKKNADVIIDECDPNNPAQRWWDDSNGNIHLPGTNMCMDLMGSGGSEDSCFWFFGWHCKDRTEYLKLHPCSSHNDQRFKILKPFGTGEIRHTATNTCFDVEGRWTHNGAKLTLYKCHGGSNQKFKATWV